MNFCNFDANESDDEDDFLERVDSSDFSSSSSLVWSAEARKQNEEDWRQIERILYCETELPAGEKSFLNDNFIRVRVCVWHSLTSVYRSNLITIEKLFTTCFLYHYSYNKLDEKSREEFVEWMEAFPHLR